MTMALLKAEVQDAVIAEVGRIGPAGFQKDPLVKRFAGRGAGRQDAAALARLRTRARRD